MKSLETRLAAIFGLDHVPEVTESTLRHYRAYLLQHFDRTTVLTGRKDFPLGGILRFWSPPAGRMRDDGKGQSLVQG